MKFDDVIEMYLDWAYEREDDISMSDVLEACYNGGYEYNKVVEAGNAKAKKIGL